MSEYDAIRPYHDHEVPMVIERVVANPDFPAAAANLIMPGFLRDTALGASLARHVLRKKTQKLRTVYDCQLFIADYFARLIDQTTLDVSVTGLENLSPGGTYLFLSNHRDIVLDSGLLNFIIHKAGHNTCRQAVGDNLMANSLAADLMRLNKSFIVEREVSGTRAVYQAMQRTSGYIRQSLDESVSVWIAQKEGRAKNGWDRTDPALIKMLALAYKDASNALQALVEDAHLLPVSVSYELDPCARAKAHELYVRETQGEYDKTAEEDVRSIVNGLLGQKGRVHLHFSPRIQGQFDDPQALAAEFDARILGGMRVFPTHVAAAAVLGDTDLPAAHVPVVGPVQNLFEEDLAATPEEERPYLLLQYANLIRNRADCVPEPHREVVGEEAVVS